LEVVRMTMPEHRPRGASTAQELAEHVADEISPDLEPGGKLYAQLDALVMAVGRKAMHLSGATDTDAHAATIFLTDEGAAPYARGRVRRALEEYTVSAALKWYSERGTADPASAPSP
jgi:hypothetical protein